MPDPAGPGPRRKGRAGLFVVLIVILMVAVIFVGMNLQHAEDLEETPPESAAAE